MRRLACIIAACCPAAAALAIAPDLWRMPSTVGDARLAPHFTAAPLTTAWMRVSLPPGIHDAFTVTLWCRIQTVGNPTNGIRMTTLAHWCPDDVVRASPDLLGDAGGHSGAGIDLTALGGSLTVSNVGFAAYSGTPTAARWPYGVCTIDGASSNTITVSVGGTDITVGPGAFHRNAVPGPSGNVVVTGAGWVRIGVSRTPCHRFFSKVGGGVGAGGVLPDGAVVTNEIVMLTYRFRAAPAGQIYQSNLGRLGCFNDLSWVATNPPVAGFHSTGIYQVGLIGVQAEPPYEWEIFDSRLHMRWLTDDELDRVHLNGVQEIGRRKIPQWR